MVPSEQWAPGMGPSGKKPRRRWFQFRLRTLLVLVTLIGGALLAWRTYAEPYRRQVRTMKLIETLGGAYETAEAGKWLRRIYGNDLQNVTLVDLTDCRDPEKYLSDVTALPALETLAVGGARFDDQCLRRLRSLTRLRGLLLDSTSVTAQELAALRAAKPESEICLSERLAIAELRELGDVEVAPGAPRPAFVSRFAKQTGEVALHVFLRESPIDDIQAEPLAGQRQAEALVLSGTGITDVGLSYVRGLSRLKLLYLDGTRLTDEGLAHLSSLETAQCLVLRPDVPHRPRLTPTDGTQAAQSA